MKYDISIVISSIRVNLLPALYESIGTSFHGSWELVIVGPTEVPKELMDKGNIKYIKDFGSPTRCWQIGILQTEGEYIHLSCDDAMYYPNVLDESFELIKIGDYKRIILNKYIEGKEDNEHMRSDEYYHLKNHTLIKDMIIRMKKDYLLLNNFLISNKLLLELGGLDCSYEVFNMALVDFSIRAFNYGAEILIHNNPVFTVTLLEASTGDHGPVFEAHTQHDTPLLFSTYFYMENFNKTTININNWQKSQEKWSRRFGN